MSNKINNSNVYRNAVKQNFDLLKRSISIQEAYIKAILIEQSEGCLLPLCKAHSEDKILLTQIFEWQRSKNIHNDSCIVKRDEKSGELTINRYLITLDEILFFIVNNSGKICGQVGFRNCFNEKKFFQLCNFFIYSNKFDENLMVSSINSLINWASKVVNLNGSFIKLDKRDHKLISLFEKAHHQKSKDGFQTNLVNFSDEKNKKSDYLIMIYRPRNNIGDKLILTAGPSISAREAFYAYDAALNGWNSQSGKYLDIFEKKFAQYIGVKYAISTSSCTGALQIALMALDIGQGDEVIVPDLTWVATANAVRYCGAIPIFADIELDTWNIDSESIQKMITPRTKAIIAVHMYGHPARMTNIVSLAKKYNLKIVEDAAPAIGSEWGGKRCGSFGDFAAFSFQGAKLLVTGEGGMLVTNNEMLYLKAKKIWDQGRNASRTFWIDGQGVKYKMSNVQAAIGLAQLERIDELIEMKRRIFSWYEEGLDGIHGIQLNKEIDEARSIYWMTSFLMDESLGIDRNEMMAQLKLMNIDTRPVFPAISQYPIWTQENHPQPVALRVGKQALNLPSGICLRQEEIHYICSCIKKLL